MSGTAGVGIAWLSGDTWFSGNTGRSVPPPSSSMTPSSTSSSTTSQMTTATLGWPQKTKISATMPTAATRSSVLCAAVQAPTGPVRSPARSPWARSQRMPDASARRVRTAAVAGPVKKAPMATTRPTTSSTRSPSLTNRTRVS